MLQGSTEYFASSSPALDHRIRALSGRIHDPKKVLYHQGDEVDGIFKVNSGVVMTYRLFEDSQRQITGFSTEGDFFGISSDGTRHDTAITATTANIAKVSMTEIAQTPDLQAELFKWTCAQLEETRDMMMTLSKKSAAEKVATFLLMLAKRQGCATLDTDIRLPMSRLDIADYLGMRFETVSRNLTKLKSNGVIGLPNRDTAHIFKMDALKTMAGVAC
jgi:CRP-like cAMP-binding protein